MPAVSPFRQVLERRETLSRAEAALLMHSMLAGEFSELQLAALLGGLAARPETAAELAGFVDAMHATSTSIPLSDAERAALVDTCGTGGDLSSTFNISTAAALVAAAVAQSASPGSPGSSMMVAKHGNRAVTSACGSADVLEALDIPTALLPQQAADALRTHRFAFLHAPAHHPAMKAVMPVRRALGVRTVFNVLGPLANPAGAQAQVMGVYAAHLVPVVAEAMVLLGRRHAFVVHGYAEDTGGMDELSIAGPSDVAEVHNGQIHLYRLTPQQIGLHSAPLDALRGGDAAANAAILRAVFRGEPGPHRDVVLLNAAAVLIAAGLVPHSSRDPEDAFRSAIQVASRCIDSGSVTALLTGLARGTLALQTAYSRVR